MTHTPGPWKVYGELGRWNVQSLSLKARKIVAHIYGNRASDKAEADAKLIAAAPDLLAALNLAKEHSELEDEVLDIVDAAISKATS